MLFAHNGMLGYPVTEPVRLPEWENCAGGIVVKYR